LSLASLPLPLTLSTYPFNIDISHLDPFHYHAQKHVPTIDFITKFQQGFYLGKGEGVARV
jgi:hypothetical protein